MNNNFTVSVLGRELAFSIIPKKDQKHGDLYQLICEEINFDDTFDAEDLTQFIVSSDFKFFIADELRRQQKVKNRRIQIRVSEEEQAFLEKRAIENGYSNTSSYVRDLVLG